MEQQWKVDGCWRLVYSTITILGAKRTKLGLRDFIALADFFQIIDVAKVRQLSFIMWEYLECDHSNISLGSNRSRNCFDLPWSWIWMAQGKASNVIKFNVRGFQMLNGQLEIEASYKITAKNVRFSLVLILTSISWRGNFTLVTFYMLLLQRVEIKLENSAITPDQVLIDYYLHQSTKPSMLTQELQLKNLFQKNYDLLLAIFNPEGWLDITYPWHCSRIWDFASILSVCFSFIKIRYVDDSLRIGRDEKGNIYVLERTEEQPWHCKC